MRSKLTLFIILAVAVFLRFYKLDSLMTFIGDQGWFYLSAKNFILTGDIPLVGITASHTWLHQGALWTYILAPVLWIFNFNPVGGAYLSAFLGVVSVIAIYFIAKEMFKSERVGLISAFLLAVSPLDITYSRMPYHTSPITVIVLLFIFAVYKYAKGKIIYLPIAAFALGVLYNLELATMVLWGVLAVIVILLKKLTFKLLFLSIISFLIPMLPMIIYDFTSKSGFYQTTAFARLIKISLSGNSSLSPESVSGIFNQLFIFNQRLIFLENKSIGALLILGSLSFLIWTLYRNYKKKKNDYAVFILGLWILLSIFGILVNKTASEAYLPMFYPGIILMISFAMAVIINKIPDFKVLIYALIVFLGLTNVYLLISNNYSINRNSNAPKFSDKLDTAKKITELAENKKYNIEAKGDGSKFENFTKDYEYLTWWYGNSPSEKNEKLKFTIEEKDAKISLTEWLEK